MIQTVGEFASELRMPVSEVLKQLNRAGVNKHSQFDMLSGPDKAKLLDYLRRSNSTESANPNTRVRIRLHRPTLENFEKLAPKTHQDVAKLTAEQLEFLKHHDIPLEKVFDASGLSAAVYNQRMKDGGYWIAFGVTPCGAAGHTLRTRHGQCIQCKPANLSYIKRHSLPGVVYVAYSLSERIVKIGTSQRSDRIDHLNSYRYGGASDWMKHYSVPCDDAGKVETTAHTILSAFSVRGRSYFKDGGWISCDELFSCSVEQAVEAVKSALASNGQKIKANATTDTRNPVQTTANQKNTLGNGSKPWKSAPWSEYDQVRHPQKPEWGVGRVCEVRDGNTLLVEFEFGGIRTLSLDYVSLTKLDERLQRMKEGVGSSEFKEARDSLATAVEKHTQLENNVPESPQPTIEKSKLQQRVEASVQALKEMSPEQKAKWQDWKVRAAKLLESQNQQQQKDNPSPMKQLDGTIPNEGGGEPPSILDFCNLIETAHCSFAEKLSKVPPEILEALKAAMPHLHELLQVREIAETVKAEYLASQRKTTKLPLSINDNVINPKMPAWGVGRVIELRPQNIALIRFDGVGAKTLSLDYVRLEKVEAGTLSSNPSSADEDVPDVDVDGKKVPCQNCGQPTSFTERTDFRRAELGWCKSCFESSLRTYQDKHTGEKRYFDDLRTIDGIRHRYYSPR